MPVKRINIDHYSIMVELKRRGMSNREIGRALGVSEGTVRYWLKAGYKPGEVKGGRESKAEEYREEIERWMREREVRGKRVVIKNLYRELKGKGHEGSYRGLVRYIRKEYPGIEKKKGKVRLETMPGFMLQIDWKEDVKVRIGGEKVRVQVLIGTLGFSRKTACVVLGDRKVESLIHGVNEILRRIGGLPEYIRTDNMKTVVKRWRGRSSEWNEQFYQYIKGLGIKLFPSRPYQPQDKGKVERKIRQIMEREVFEGVYRDMKELQERLDETVDQVMKESRCGATGFSVEASFTIEKRYLRPLPEVFPEIPIASTRARVSQDGMVPFGGNAYQVGHEYAGQMVWVMQYGQEVVVYHDGTCLGRFPSFPKARGMNVLSERVIRNCPPYVSPLVQASAFEVARHQLAFYEEVLEQHHA